MTHDFRIGGIVTTTVVPAFFAALLLTLLVTRLLVRIDFYRFVWHRPLVDVAILAILFSAIVMLMPDGWTGA